MQEAAARKKGRVVKHQRAWQYCQIRSANKDVLKPVKENLKSLAVCIGRSSLPDVGGLTNVQQGEEESSLAQGLAGYSQNVMVK